VQFLAGPGLADAVRLDGRGWAAVLFLGIACSGFAYVAWYDALERLPASEVGALLYLEPLVAMGVAAAVLGEPVGLAMVAGGAVILFGVWLVNRPRPARAGTGRR
jgi:drug/metabolite transporter (DMT)-like permease